MAVKKKKIPQTSGIPLWCWTVGSVLLTAVIVLGYRAEQTEQHLNTMQAELERTKQEAVHARSGAPELEQLAQNLRSKLEAAERQLQELNEAADRAKAEAIEREKHIAMLRQGIASCDEFFEAWDVKASPPIILAIFAITREASAAKDCIDKGDIATACKHWRALLAQIERIGSPVNESRIEIEGLMRQNDCGKYVGSAPASNHSRFVKR
jgi:hypothetical protein